MPEKKTVSDQIKDEFTKIHYYRDTKNGIVGGVISGLARYTGWDVTPLRILFAILLIFTAFMPFAIAYLVVWICAPDESSLPAKTGAKTKAAKAESEDDDGSEAPARTAQNTVSLVLRIVLMVFGIIGFLTFVPMLIALIPLTILSIIAIASTTIVDAPLFVATAIMVGVMLFTIVSLGLQVSTALVTARFGKSAVVSLVAGCVAVMILATASITTGALWAHRVGRDEVENTWNNVTDDMSITIDHHDDKSVRVDLGPIHIRTN